jgi:hypothetical protein
MEDDTSWFLIVPGSEPHKCSLEDSLERYKLLVEMGMCKGRKGLGCAKQLTLEQRTQDCFNDYSSDVKE